MLVNPWHELASGPDMPRRLNAVIEIPRGSRNKYELDKESGLFRLDRLLYSAVHYPGDYGFIPRTLAEDNDPLDILVMTTVPTFTGCLIEARPIGVLIMHDKGETDEKVLAVPVRDPLYQEYEDLKDVAPHFLLEVEHFFTIYKDLEGAKTLMHGWSGRAEADAIIQAACERYLDEHGQQHS